MSKRITSAELAALGIHTEDGQVYSIKKSGVITPASTPVFAGKEEKQGNSPKPLPSGQAEIKDKRGLPGQTGTAGTNGDKRRSKYNAQRTESGGITFDSKKEASRWEELQLMLRAGEISELRRQVEFALCVEGELICRYRADFVYRNKAGRRIVEDAKGVRTGEYIIKRKLMLACHAIEIQEV